MNVSKITKTVAVAAVALGLIALPSAAQASNPEPTASAKTITYATLPLPANVVGNKQLSNNSVDWLKLGSQSRAEIRSLQAKAEAATVKANQALAKPDANSLGAAYYAVAFYDSGDTNAGAIATVACVKETDVAISGGVQTVGLDATANSRNTPVNSSFPGRMDWTTNAPKANRLDGWIVQFGGNAGTVSDKDPLKVKVYALCVPGLTTAVTQTYLQSAND